MVQQGKSSDILLELYGNEVSEYQKILEPHIKELVLKYPNKNLEKYISNLHKKIIAIAPITFCVALLKDLGINYESEDLAALGLHMLAISTHDDVVDEMPKDRIEVAALTYAGNIATNEGSKILLNNGKIKAAEVLLDSINSNHFYQQKVIETLWQREPESFEDYANCVNHICVFTSIGLLYGLALAENSDFKDQILEYAHGYGISLQLIDDLREVEEDKILGYNSFPLKEGEPYTRSIKEIHNHLQQSREAIPENWKSLQQLLTNLENFIKDF